MVKCLKQNLRENSSENLLSSASRLLLHEGRLTLAGNVPKCLCSGHWLNRIMLCYGRARTNLYDTIWAGAGKKKQTYNLSERGQELTKLQKGWVICMTVSCHIWIFYLPDAEEIRLTCLHLSLRRRVLLSSSRMWQKDVRKFRLSHTNCPIYRGLMSTNPSSLAPHLLHVLFKITGKSRQFSFFYFVLISAQTAVVADSLEQEGNV